MLLILKSMEFFFRLNVIRMVLENIDHFGGLFNHSTLSGICQIFSIHNLVANRLLFKRGLLNLLNCRFLMKIERLKILLYGIAFGFIHRKKTGEKIKNNIFKQIPPPLYLLPTIFSLTEA